MHESNGTTNYFIVVYLSGNDSGERFTLGFFFGDTSTSSVILGMVREPAYHPIVFYGSSCRDVGVVINNDSFVEHVRKDKPGCSDPIVSPTFCTVSFNS